MVSALFFLASLVAVVCAKPITRPTTMVLAGQRTAVPSGFVQEKEGPGANQTLDMLINLAQNNLPGLEKALLAASTPGNSQYGRHLTKDQIKSYVSPSKDTTSLVTSWLSQNGIKAGTLTPAGDWLNFTIPVEKANALLNANYSSFKTSNGQTLLRTMSYSIPSNLVGHINAIHPTTAFDVVKLLPKSSSPVLVSKSKKGGNSKNSTSVGNSTSSASDASSTNGASSTTSKGGKSKKAKGGKSKDGASTGNSTSSASDASSTASKGDTSKKGKGKSKDGSSAGNSTTSASSPSSTGAASSNSTSSTSGTSSTNGTASSNSTSNIAPTGNVVDPSCDEAVTPTCLQQLYGIPTTPATQQSNVLAVSGFINQFASQADLSTFLGQFRPDVTNTFTLQSVDGGINDETTPGTEASLDIQYTIGVATDVKTNFVSVGSDNTDGISGFLDIINQLMADPPSVLSTSYGFDETDIPADIANSLCNAYMQLTAMGTSIIFSSGDGGVGGSTAGETCTTFIPTFPSGCPYVTSVGATTGIQEAGASFSSGGFSNIFPQPSFQQQAVSQYLSTLGATNQGDFNASGRAFPDVSAQGENVQIVVNGVVTSVAGTSCSAPIFASVISLINDQRIAASKAPLGFLNPLLYANPGVFNDIQTGNNPGCGTNGFPAAAGWDPITGLGTPKFDDLKGAGLAAP